MQIYIQVKQLGKRRPQVVSQPFIISKQISIVRDLLSEIVSFQVNQFNQRPAGDIEDLNFDLIKYLSTQEIDKQALTGKINFNLDYRKQHQDINIALENVFSAFNDGLFRIFLNDNELSSLDENINLQEGDQLTFIRLVMLAGRIW